jgi:hypothetical protein
MPFSDIFTSTSAPPTAFMAKTTKTRASSRPAPKRRRLSRSQRTFAAARKLYPASDYGYQMIPRTDDTWRHFGPTYALTSQSQRTARAQGRYFGRGAYTGRGGFIGSIMKTAGKIKPSLDKAGKALYEGVPIPPEWHNLAEEVSGVNLPTNIGFKDFDTWIPSDMGSTSSAESGIRARLGSDFVGPVGAVQKIMSGKAGKMGSSSPKAPITEETKMFLDKKRAQGNLVAQRYSSLPLIPYSGRGAYTGTFFFTFTNITLSHPHRFEKQPFPRHQGQLRFGAPLSIQLQRNRGSHNLPP